MLGGTLVAVEVTRSAYVVSGAEADLSGRGRRDLDVRQLLDRYDDPAALRVRQRQHATLAQSRADLLLDIARLERGVDGELTAPVDDADLDLHAEDLLWCALGVRAGRPLRSARRCGDNRGCRARRARRRAVQRCPARS